MSNCFAHFLIIQSFEKAELKISLPLLLFFLPVCLIFSASRGFSGEALNTLANEHNLDRGKLEKWGWPCGNLRPVWSPNSGIKKAN